MILGTGSHVLRHPASAAASSCGVLVGLASLKGIIRALNNGALKNGIFKDGSFKNGSPENGSSENESPETGRVQRWQVALT